MEYKPPPRMAGESKASLMFRAPLRRLAPALTIAACLLAAPPAMGATATVDYGQDRLEFTASAGERNLLTVTGSGDTYYVEDAVSNISAGSGCTQQGSKRVRCSSNQIDSTYFDLRDQDDSLTNSASIDVEASAGDGADKLTGGSSNDKLYGGNGDDLLDGGFGADVIDGDDGRDRVSYAARTAGVNVNLGTWWGGDGQSGEWDFVSSIEEVVGGSGDDRIAGTGAANTFIGGAGNDTLEGEDGNDVLEGGTGNDKLDAGTGDDTLLSRDDGPDNVMCGAGADSIDADAVDALAADCERPAAPTTALPGAATLDRVPATIRLTRKGYVRIRVTCPTTAVTGCSGTIDIAFLARSAGVRVSAAAKRRTRKKFSLKAGQSKVTKVKISRNGRRRVLKRKRAKCRVRVHTNSAGTVSKKITVKAPKKSKKSRRKSR
jgi:hypothetical protein